MISTTTRAGRALDRAMRARLVRRLGRAMRAAGVGDAEVSLALVGDEAIRALNRDFRRKDRPTDVLSFSQREGEAPAPPAGGQPLVLGDIVISVETAGRQAAAGGRALEAELLHLAVHGLAHLLGYDHATRAEERVMFGYEAALRGQALGRGQVAAVAAPETPRPPRRPVTARR